MNDILRRIEQQTGIAGLSSILAERLEPTDLHSLLLEVYKLRAGRRAPNQVLSDYLSNRFVHPAAVDPRVILEWDRVAFDSLPETFVPIEISPLCPLATNSAVAAVSQNRSIVTTRNLEVVSDATNVLALECAVRRRALLKSGQCSAESVHLAASHRLVRPQNYGTSAVSPHFRLFNLCSAGRSIDGVRFEPVWLLEHIRFYLRALRRFIGGEITLQLALTDIVSDKPRDLWQPTLFTPLKEEFATLDICFDQDRVAGRGYYREACFKIHLISSTQRLELADGGAVDWMEKLLDSAKEKLVISGIGSERVCMKKLEAGNNVSYQ